MFKILTPRTHALSEQGPKGFFWSFSCCQAEWEGQFRRVER